MSLLFFARACARRRVALLAGALACCAHAAATVPLTLDEAQRLAVLRSHELSGLASAAGAAREMAVAAGQLPDPVLKVGVDNLPIQGADRFSPGADFMTMRRLGVTQELTRADKRHWRAESYRRGADQARLARAAALAALERDTALAWFERAYAERAVALVGEQQALARQELAAAEAAYRSGRVTLVELVAARAAVPMLDDGAADAALKLRGATIRLARWVGEGAEAPLAGPPAVDALRFAPATLAARLARHPQVALLAGQQAIAEADVALARANTRADWSVELAYQQRGGAYPNMLSLGLSMPLQWDRRQRQDRELAAKLALRDQAGAGRDEMLRVQAADIAVLLAEWDDNRLRQRRYQDALLPLAEARDGALLAAYRGGKASLAELLGGRRARLELQLQALRAQADGARLWAQLSFIFPAGDDDAPPRGAAPARELP